MKRQAKSEAFFNDSSLSEGEEARQFDALRGRG